MRKTLALVLSIVMVLSLVAVGISAAPAGTAINKVEDLAALQSDGTYYLNADLTIPATTIEAPFTGTIDGNGHTITVSQPLFAEFNGTIKNLTIKGAVDGSAAAGHTGTIAKTVNGNAKFENITNEATVKGFLTDADSTYRAGAGGLVGCILKGVVTFTKCVNKAEIIGHATGGIVGSYDDAEKLYDKTACAVTFTDCENSGHISASESTKTSNAGAAGGILGIGNKLGYVYFTNCKNSGKIEADKACGGPAGGIVAYIYTALENDDKGEAVINGCVNSGEVLSADSQAGGISGWLRLCSTVINCVNSGFIHSGINASDAMKGYCGGILCRCSGDSKNISTTITNCLNSGKVASGRDQAGGILAYHNGGNVTVTNCTNSGVITYDANPSTKVHAAGIVANHAQNKATDPVGVITCTKCVNTGDIYATNSYCAGIVGYVYGTSTQYGVLTDCVNKGTLHIGPTGFAGQMISYTNTVKTVYENCIGAGKIADYVEGGHPAVIGCSSADASQYTLTNYKLLKDAGELWYSYTATADNAANIVLIADADASKVTFVSADEAAAAINALGEIGYKAPVTPPATGDAMVWVVVVALVSVLGMGIAVKAKNN